MADRHVPSLARLVRQRDELRRIVDRFDDHVLAELRRRAGEPVGVLVLNDDGELVRDPTVDRPLEEGGVAVRDGYSAGRSDAGVASSEISRPTEAKVLAAAGGQVDERTDEAVSPDRWEPVRDPIVESISDIFGGLGEALGVLRRADRRRAYVFAAGDAIRGRQSSLQGDCKACRRPVAGTPNDRLRNGYCNACRMAWDRLVDAGEQPDRDVFERDRRLRREAS